MRTNREETTFLMSFHEFTSFFGIREWSYCIVMHLLKKDEKQTYIIYMHLKHIIVRAGTHRLIHLSTVHDAWIRNRIKTQFCIHSEGSFMR